MGKNNSKKKPQTDWARRTSFLQKVENDLAKAERELKKKKNG